MFVKKVAITLKRMIFADNKNDCITVSFVNLCVTLCQKNKMNAICKRTEKKDNSSVLQLNEIALIISGEII